jgi:predicted nucleic acid-binding protein
VTRYLLDTNIISNPSKLTPSPELEIWMSMQKGESLFVSAWSLAEIWHGILLMPSGKKRTSLEEWYAGPFGPERLFSDRVLAFDAAAAHRWAELMVEGRLTGRSRSLPDTIIASIALTQNCILVTDNARDFPDLPMLNPMRPLGKST